MDNLGPPTMSSWEWCKLILLAFAGSVALTATYAPVIFLAH
jgi:hypothetical protein